ncbi:MAG: site-specific integrase [Thermacetogeniaceae bacterium]
MAGNPKIKKIVLKSGRIVYRTTVDAGTDPKTGNRKQKLLTADTERDLKKEAAKILADAARGIYFEPEKQSFGEYLDYWLEAYGKPNLGIRTYESYKSIVDKHLKPALGQIPLAKLLPVHIQKYYTETLAGGRIDTKKTVGRSLSANTVLHHHRLIREALHHAVKWEMLVRNVADACKPPRKGKYEIKALTREGVNTVIEATRDTYLYMPTYLAASTGMRLGEVLGLRWEDVNLKEEYLSVTQTLKQTNSGPQFGPPKSRSSRRRIDLIPEVVTELKAHHKRQAQEKLDAGQFYQKHNLVCCLQDGSPVPIANFSGYWKNVVNRALDKKRKEAEEAAAAKGNGEGRGEAEKKDQEKPERIHFHQLRHTAATLALETGEPIGNVSAMLGHSSIAITGDIYNHVTPAGRKQTARALGKALFGHEE